MSDNEFWLGFWLIVLAAWVSLLIFMYLVWCSGSEAKNGDGDKK